MKVFVVLAGLLSLSPLAAFAEDVSRNDHVELKQVEKQDGVLGLRNVAMPADINSGGTIFGGWILSQMDIAGGTISSQRAGGRVVTAGVDEMSFLRPIYIGDVVSIYGEIARIGRTSMAVFLVTWVLRDGSGEFEKVGEGIFTFVAIDDNGIPVPVPQE